MLHRLSISNYALIDDLSVTFERGLNIVTGETGAGKSVILGALSLILGIRADYSVLRNPEKKCIIEAGFRIGQSGMESFFSENDLDYDPDTIIRREISANGKSRVFINDTPVTLQQLRVLVLRLIDIHSQHQNLELGTQQFQLRVIDTVARNQNLLKEYRESLRTWQSLEEDLSSLKTRASKSRNDLDYYRYQFNQLEEARLQPGEQILLEEERNTLVHAEEIKSALDWSDDLLRGEHFPVVPRIKEAVTRMDKISGYLKEAGEIRDRLNSTLIELSDLAHETARLSEKISFDPGRMAEISNRLDLIYSLEQKHQLSSVEELLDLKEALQVKIREIDNYDEDIQKLEKELTIAGEKLKQTATLLTGSRKKVIPLFETQVTQLLRQLAMPHARFRVVHEHRKQYAPDGADHVWFYFSANRDTEPAEISKIASGGEISRVMLALKTLVSDSNMLSTIIFDEIDSGISGETALKMGDILKKLSGGLQVINITHLPQIAGKGDHHFLVSKQDDGSGTFITIRKLTQGERLEELARMVGGDDPSESARQTAREMLERNLES